MTVKRFRFSLIELLAVIALVSLLTALMLPAFRKMTAGNAVDQMASQIKLALEQAQSQAAMSRKYTALLFYQDGTVVKFALAYVTKEGKFDSWFDNSNVLKTVEGTTIAKMQSGEDDLPIINSEVDTSEGIEMSGLYESLDSDEPSLKANIANLTDIFTEISEIKDKGLEIKLSGSDKLKGIVFSPYGGILKKEIAKNLYIVIAEAIILPNNKKTIQYPGYADNNKSHNYRLLELNNFTGRVEYK